MLNSNYFYDTVTFNTRSSKVAESSKHCFKTQQKLNASSFRATEGKRQLFLFLRTPYFQR